VQEELKRKCFKVARAKDGFGSHHIIFYYGYGANGFNAVPFKNVLPWTEEHLEEARKGYKRGQSSGPLTPVVAFLAINRGLMRLLCQRICPAPQTRSLGWQSSEPSRTLRSLASRGLRDHRTRRLCAR
jgi:hypothetical protein